MITVTVSSDLSNTGEAHSFEIEEFNGVQDFYSLVAKNDNIRREKMLNSEGLIHPFLMLVVDGTMILPNDLVEELRNAKEILILNAIAGG